MIRAITKNDLTLCLEVIHKSFATVAEDFEFTREKNPGHVSFMPLEKLQSRYDSGWNMYGYYHNDLLIGFFALSKETESEYELHHLAILPNYRHNGYGIDILDYAKKKVAEWGGSKIKISIIEESIKLKNWYIANGFKHIGVHKFEHLPFTVGFMECDI